MKGQIKSFPLPGRDCFVYCPPGYDSTGRRYPVIYFCGEGKDGMAETLSGLEKRFSADLSPFFLVGVSADWDRELTPWPAPAVFRGSDDFGGEADRYLDELIKKVKPAIDETFPTLADPANTGICGYSLGGLAALYALYRCPDFGAAASISGSLWYDGFLDHISSHAPANPFAKAYLSLGRGEEKTRNRRMAVIGEYTRQARQILARQLETEIPLVMSDGGHGHQAAQRKQAALIWLAQVLRGE